MATANTRQTEETVRRLAHAAAMLDEKDLLAFANTLGSEYAGQAFLNTAAALLLDRYRMEIE